MIVCDGNQWTKEQLEETFDHVATQVKGDMASFGAFEVDADKFRAKVMKSILEYALPAGCA